MRSTKSIIGVLVGAGLLDESDAANAERLVDVVMAADTAPLADTVKAIKAATHKAVSVRRSNGERMRYFVTKVGAKADMDSVGATSERPCFKVIRKAGTVGIGKADICRLTGLTQSQADNAVYGLQTRGYVESREL